MRRQSSDTVTFLFLVAILFAAKGVELLAGVEYNLAGQQAPAAGLLLYALLGAAGLWLARRTGFPGMWEESVDNKSRFLIPAAAGMVLALGMVAMDLWLQAANYPQIPQTALPEGLLPVLIAGMSEEFALRLFLIPLIVWLVSTLLLRGRWQEQVFWGAAALSAALYALLALGALAGRADLAGIASAPPFILLGLPTILLYSMFAAYTFRRAGFLAVLSLRFAFYFVWHVLWALR